MGRQGKLVVEESRLLVPVGQAKRQPTAVMPLVGSDKLLPYALSPSPTCSQGLMYRGILDALLQTARTEGIFGMYKGIGASYFRLGPHTILSLFFWDQLRILYYTYSK